MKALLNRRALMQRLAGASLLPMIMRTMGAEAAAASDTILVVIDMVGGNDGLNTIVPLNTAQFGQYAKLRPNVGLSASSLVLKFDANYQTAVGSGQTYAFNPAMALNYPAASGGSPSLLTNNLPALYNSGHFAIVVGAGLPASDPQRMNHHCASLDWYAGQPQAWAGAGASSGWLASALAKAKTGKLGPTASMFGSTLLIESPTNGGLVLGPSLPRFAPSYRPSVKSLPASYAQWLATPASGGSALKFANGSISNTMNATKYIDAISGDASVSIADYPWMNASAKTSLELQLSSVAQLILGDAGISGFVTELYSFDTHDAQLETHAGLLSVLSGAMANFYAYMKAKNASSNVVILTISEFGRTPHDNSALGTDHGQASVCFVLGDPVKGGVYGDYPSLTQLDGGQLAVTVDFRNVISDVINKIGGNPAAIVGANYPRLGFI
jgi:uncharacterized protein (DUF1501 family)